MSNQKLNGILMPYQMNWLNDESPVIVWEKSRRIGASFVDSLKSVMLAAKRREDGGSNVNYLSYNKYMTQQYIADAAHWAKKIGAAAGAVQEIVLKDDDKDIITYQIKFASGHKIQALSSHPRSLRSTKGRVVLDEFAFVDQPDELLKAALALGMWGGQIAILSTHNGADNPFYELVESIKSGKLPYKLHHTDFNEAVAQGLFKAVCRSQKKAWSQATEEKYVAEIVAQYGDAADEELFCIPRKSGGAYIPLTLIEAAMERECGPVIRLKAPAADFVDWPKSATQSWTVEVCQNELAPALAACTKTSRHFFGQDFGRSGDLSVLWVLAEEINLELKTTLIIEMQNLPFKVQELILKFVGKRLPRFSGGALDAGGNGAALAEFARQTWGAGLIREVKFSESFYNNEFPPLKAAFEDKLLTVPKDSFIRDDLRQIKVIGGVPKLENVRKVGASGQRHGDSAIALLLAHFAKRQGLAGDPWEPAFREPTETDQLLARFNN